VTFEFTTPTRIVFGRGSLDGIGAIAASFGRCAMIVRGGEHLDRYGAFDRVRRSLSDRGVACVAHGVRGEPDVSAVDEAAMVARQYGCDVVIGLGGGSVLDAAKAVAGLLTNEGSVIEYLEVIGKGRAVSNPGAPFIAVPTTAGTGSEVTRNAVVASREHRFKASMRSEHLLARVALVDPALTDNLPPDLTASTGLDALTQLIEPYVSNRAEPITDALALRGVALALRALPRAVQAGSDASARDDMALASLMGGMCLANAGLGAVHGFAAPLGASFPVPHGTACAALLPHVMRANVAALRARHPSSPALHRYAELASVILARNACDRADVDQALEQVADLVRQLRVPALSSFGVSDDDVSDLVARARRASSMRYNPVELTDDELTGCMRAALHGR
jgi:alcohol dehydrogenase class IV